MDKLEKQHEAVRKWKAEHRDEVLAYHKQYNANRDNYQHRHKQCAICGGSKVYFDIKQHERTKKHIRKAN